MNFYTSLNVIFYKHIRSNFATLNTKQLANTEKLAYINKGYNITESKSIASIVADMVNNNISISRISGNSSPELLNAGYKSIVAGWVIGILLVQSDGTYAVMLLACQSKAIIFGVGDANKTSFRYHNIIN